MRLPDGQGGYTIEWVPVELGNTIDFDRLPLNVRTWPGDEVQDFRKALAAYRQQQGEGGVRR